LLACRAVALGRFKNIVATGLWPVCPSVAFHNQEDGPQGRGYSGYGFI
jgi:hypothetical protein